MAFLTRHAQQTAYAIALVGGLVLSTCALLVVIWLAEGSVDVDCARSILEQKADFLFTLVFGVGVYGVVVYEIIAMLFESRGVARLKRADMALEDNSQKHILTTNKERLAFCLLFAILPVFGFHILAAGRHATTLCVGDPAPVTASPSNGE